MYFSCRFLPYKIQLTLTKTRNLLETIERKGLWGRFLFISHKSNPWKTGTTKAYTKSHLQPQIMRVISQNKSKFPRNHWAKGVMMSFSMLSHKSNPRKTGITKVYKNIPLQPQIMRNTSKKKPKTCSEPLS